MNHIQSPRELAIPDRLTITVVADPGNSFCPYQRLGILTWLLRFYGMSIVDIKGGVDRDN